MPIAKLIKDVYAKIIAIDSNSMHAITLTFLSSAISIIANIYSTTLFLSSYPRTWLPYLLVCNAIATVLFSFALVSALTRSIQRNAQIVLGLFAASFIVFIGVYHLNFHWGPFIVAVFTGSIGSLSSVISWNILPLAFGLRSYKQMARYAAQIWTLGVIIGGFAIPILLTKFPLESLLYLIIICFIGSVVSIHSLVLLQQTPQKTRFQAKASPWQYPLYKKLLMFSAFTVVTQVLIEYTFKFEVAHHLTGKAMGNFLGYYSAIVNILALTIGVATTKYLLKFFRIGGLLYATQILALLGCLLVIFVPSLWTISALNAVKTLFYYNYAALAIEIILNILPSAIRVAGKLQIKTTVSPVCTIIVYFFLLLVVNFVGTKEIIIFTGVMILPLIYFVKGILSEYKMTLQSEIEFRRFNVIQELTPEDIVPSENISSEISWSADTLHALVHSPDPVARKEAACIICDSYTDNFADDLSLLIADKNDGVSEIAISAVAKINKLSFVPQILSRLTPGAVTYIVKAVIAKLGAVTIPFILAELSRSKNPVLLIKVLVAISGDEAENTIITLINSGDIFQRSLIAKEVNYHACKQEMSVKFKQEICQLILAETQHIDFLNKLLLQYTDQIISTEINSRVYLAKQRALFWLAIATDPVQINKLIPSLLKSAKTSAYKLTQEKALELLEIYIKDEVIKRQIISIFEPPTKKSTLSAKDDSIPDIWLSRVIQSQTNPAAGENMDLLQKVFELRQVELFKKLSGETLLAIAEETQLLSFKKGETIFLENDAPDGLYCISAGTINIIRKEKLLNVLHEHESFGELALIDDSVRTASAIADTDCTLLLLEKSTFDRLTDDLPEVLRAVTRVVLRYLRQNLAGTSEESVDKLG